VICPISGGLFQSDASVYSDPAGVGVEETRSLLST
jgi:hypothetical protein